MARNKTDYQIKMTMKHAREGSPDQQTTRHNVLMDATKVLQERYGYSKHRKIQNSGLTSCHISGMSWA